jgi:hypothetical protein
LLVLPPVLRGHAAAGDDPGLAVAVGALVAEALGRAVAVGMGEVEGAVVGESEREADVLGVGVGDAPPSG